METSAADLHAVPHWERINPIKNRVEIAFDLGVGLAQTSVEQLRRALFTTLNNDVLPQIAKAAPAGADLHAIGSTDSNFDVATVDFSVAKGDGGKWHKEGNGKDAVLSGNVAVTLQTDYPFAAGDALQTVRASVADQIAAMIAESYGRFKTKSRLTINAVEFGRDRLIGNYTSDTGYTMNVAKGDIRGSYAFLIKDSSGNIRIQNTARGFTDMSTVIQVWKMTRAESMKDSQPVADRERKAA